MIATGEYELLTEDAGVVERPGRAVLLLEGGEAAEFLQGQVTNDVEALEPGQGCYAALLDHKGKLRADMRVLRLGPDAPPGRRRGDRPRGAAPQLRDLQPRARRARQDLTDERTVSSVIGPAARERLGIDLPEEEHAFVEGELGLYVATDLGVDVIGAEPELTAAVRGDGGMPAHRVRPARLGLDMGSTTIPQEAGLNERAVSFSKGCYVGQETVARLHYKGKPNRHLRGLRLSEPATHGDPILLGEKEVGTRGLGLRLPHPRPDRACARAARGGAGRRGAVVGGSPATVVTPVLMAGWALAFLGVFGILAVGLRAFVQYRRTGSPGISGVSGEPGSAEWWGGVLFVLAWALLVAARRARRRMTPSIPSTRSTPTSSRPPAWGSSAAGLLTTLFAQYAMGDSWRIGVQESDRTELVTGGSSGWCATRSTRG